MTSEDTWSSNTVRDGGLKSKFLDNQTRTTFLIWSSYVYIPSNPVGKKGGIHYKFWTNLPWKSASGHLCPSPNLRAVDSEGRLVQGPRGVRSRQRPVLRGMSVRTGGFWLECWLLPSPPYPQPHSVLPRMWLPSANLSSTLLTFEFQY